MSNLDQDEIIAALLTGPRLAGDKRPAREMVAQWVNVLEAVRDWRAREGAQPAHVAAPAAPEATVAQPPADEPQT